MQLVLLTLLAFALLAAPAVAGQTLLVVGQSGVDKADALEAETGVKPAGAMWYDGVYDDTGPVLD